MPELGGNVRAVEANPSNVLGKAGKGNSERCGRKKGPGNGQQSTQVAKEFGVQCCAVRRGVDRAPGWPGGKRRSNPDCHVKLPGCALCEGAWPRQQVKLMPAHTVHQASR